MIQTRIIPILLLQGNGLYKTQKFKNAKYIGDPLNAVKIFNEKEVNELIVIDILATRQNYAPRLEIIRDIAGECFMPVCYGGGITTLDQIKEITFAGIEKVAINSFAVENSDFIREAAKQFGSSTIVVSIDVKKNIFGKYQVHTKGGTQNTKLDAVEFARHMEEEGAGEILLNSIEKDGMMNGYDLDLIHKVSSTINIPLIACGGAGKLDDMIQAKSNGASALAAGSFFVFHGKHRAVLISYPSPEEISAISNAPITLTRETTTFN